MKSTSIARLALLASLGGLAACGDDISVLSGVPAKPDTVLVSPKATVSATWRNYLTHGSENRANSNLVLEDALSGAQFKRPAINGVSVLEVPANRAYKMVLDNPA